MVVALSSEDDDPSKSIGAWKRISPDEPIFAAISRVAEDIRAGASQEDLETWRKMFLSVSCRFEHHPTEDSRHFRCQNLRMAAQSDYESLARSDVQIAFSIKAFQIRKETTVGPLSCSKIVELYKENAKAAGSSNMLKESFIDSCLSVWSKVLSNERMRATILDLEEKLGKWSPFRSIYILQSIINKAKTLEQRVWVIEGIAARIADGTIISTDITQAMLTGTSRNEKGLVELLLIKQEILRWIEQSWMVKQSVSQEVCERVRQLSEGWPTYTELFGKGKDVSWMGSLSVHGSLLLRLIESMVFKSQEWDSNLRTWLRANKTLEEIVAQPVLAETLQGIADNLKQENLMLTVPDKDTSVKDGKLNRALTIDDIMAESVSDSKDPRELSEVQRLIHDKDPDGKLGEYRDLAQALTSQQVKLIKEPESAITFAEILRGSAIGSMLEKLTKTSGYVGVMYHPPSSGEPVTHPHIRICPLRDDNLRKLVKGVCVHNT